MSRRILLSTGDAAIVDDEDHERLAAHRWNKTADGHARRRTDRRGTVLMHREVMNAAPGQIVDHVNGDKLDNRRHNLRFATITQNEANRGPRHHNQSGYRGVYRNGKKWRACIRENGKTNNLGTFATAEEAATAYDAAAARIHGEFARPNII